MSKTLKCPKTTNRSFCIGATNDIVACRFGIAKPHRQRNLLKRAGIVITNCALAWFSSGPGVEPATHVNPVRRFTDRRTAIHRIWRAIQERHLNQIAGAAQAEDCIKGSPTLKHKVRTDHQTAAAARRGDAAILMDLTGWQAHSVRGFLSAQLSKKRGLRIESFTRNGQRVYRIRK